MDTTAAGVQRPQPVAGDQIGPFRVVAPLGSGRSAHVLLARHRVSLVEVALKVWRGPVHRTVREEFRRECRTHAMFCDVRGVVPLLSCSADDEPLLWAALRPADESLGDRIRAAGRLPLRDALRVGSLLADVLGRVHRRGVLHRDVHPGNVLLLGGRPLLADFGLAVTFGAFGHDPAAGTAGYVAPELGAGGTPSVASDVHSLGLTVRAVLGAEVAEEVPIAALGAATALDSAARPADAWVLRDALLAHRRRLGSTRGDEALHDTAPGRGRTPATR